MYLFSTKDPDHIHQPCPTVRGGGYGYVCIIVTLRLALCIRYEMKVRGLLDSVQQRKADIIAEYQEKMRVAVPLRAPSCVMSLTVHPKPVSQPVPCSPAM